MKKFVAILALLVSMTASAQELPNIFAIRSMQQRIQMYLTQGQTYHQVAASMTQYYRYSERFFTARYDPYTNTTDFVMTLYDDQGRIYHMQTLVTYRGQ